MKKTFIFYTEYEDIFDELSDEEAGRLIKIVFDFCRTGNVPKLPKYLKLAFIPIQKDLERNSKKYDEIVKKRRLAGKKGGVAKANKMKQMVASDNKCWQNVVNLADNDNDNDNDNVNDNVLSSSEKKPTKEEVEEFIKEEKLNVDAKSFYEHYSDLEWVLNGTPVNSWKHLCRTWDKNNKTPVTPKEYSGDEKNRNVIALDKSELAEMKAKLK